MTRAALDEYRIMRAEHLCRGIGRVRDPERYEELGRGVRAFVADLDDPDERRAMELLYLCGATVIQAAFEMGRSERTVYRLRESVLSRLGG